MATPIIGCGLNELYGAEYSKARARSNVSALSGTFLRCLSHDDVTQGRFSRRQLRFPWFALFALKVAGKGADSALISIHKSVSQRVSNVVCKMRTALKDISSR